MLLRSWSFDSDAQVSRAQHGHNNHGAVDGYASFLQISVQLVGDSSKRRTGRCPVDALL